MKPTGGPFCDIPLDRPHYMRATKTERDLLYVWIERIFGAAEDLYTAMCDARHDYVVDAHGLARATVELGKLAGMISSATGQVEGAGVDATPKDDDLPF